MSLSALRRAPLWALAVACANAPAQSLPDLLHAALPRDPAVAAAEASRRAADERVLQARGSLGPNAQFTASRTETQYTEFPTPTVFSPSTDPVERDFKAKQAQLQITQPLLAGARWAALDAADAQAAQAAAALAQARAESAQRLLEAVFAVLQARDALRLAQAQTVEVAAQLQAARRSRQVGTATIIDQREAEARSDAVAAERIAAEVDLALREQVLAELTGGLPAATLQRRGLDGDRMPVLPAGGVAQALAEAEAGSPALAQARYALAAADAEIDRAWQAHAPTADFSYTYTMSRDTGTVTSTFPRRGDTSAFGVNISVPLFASGATQARVREARALRDKAAAELETARRNLWLGVHQQFAAARSAIGQARGYEAAARSQELAMRASRRAYEVGTKVNADVLESQSRWFEARRDLARARYGAWLAWARLQALGGTLDARLLADIDGLLVEQTEAPQARPLAADVPAR